MKDLNSHIWDQWTDENGTIGKAYGYQLGKKYEFKTKEGIKEMDQVDYVLYLLKNDPSSRRIMTNIFNHEELKDYKTLLQELFQSKFHVIPNYEILSGKGPDHNKKFEIAVKLKDEIVGIGAGTSKKEAEKNAAREAFFLFKK